MTRKALVEANVCTWHFFNKQIEKLGEVPIPVTFVRLPDGGFQMTYSPSSTKESHTGNACGGQCANGITTKLEEFADWVEAKIVTPVEFEENYVPVDDTPEEYGDGQDQDDDDQGSDLDDVIDTDLPEDGTDLGMDDDDAQAVTEHIQSGPVGEKVTPARPTGVNNPKPAPKPAQTATNDEPWRLWYPDGYAPSMDQPKGEEKKACENWYWGLKPHERVKLGTWPKSGRLNNKIVYAWHTSETYAEKFYNMTNA